MKHTFLIQSKISSNVMHTFLIQSKTTSNVMHTFLIQSKTTSNVMRKKKKSYLQIYHIDHHTMKDLYFENNSNKFKDVRC